MNHKDVSIEICKALGLNANAVSSLTVSLNHNSWPTVNVELMITTEEAIGFINILHKCELVPKAPGPSGSGDNL